MEKNKDIEISIIKGDKLFNQNTPFAINLTTPEPDVNDKKSNADLICVIDVSFSMYGAKIEQVKESLKTLINLMDEKDRICLILFCSTAENYFDLNYLTKENKEILANKINQINVVRGTNILSGLEIAINVIKKNCNNENVSSILLLSDGQDNYLNDIQLAESFKNLTKGLGLSFTLNTFGYGKDHDAKIMNKLSSIRDGSFFYVENYKKITEYFVSILGGCISVISKKVDLELQILNNNCKIMKVFGKDNLYHYENNEIYFKTTMLQFICGKEYTFVLEILVDEKNIKINDEIIKVEIIYEDISQNNKKVEKEKKYNYSLKDLQYSKANEEYIRVYVYDILDKALKLKERNQNEQGKMLLDKLEKWLLKNYKGKNEYYLKDIQNAKGLFSNNKDIIIKTINSINSLIKENSLKRTGNSFKNCNSIQINMLKSIPLKQPIQKKEIPNNFNKNTLTQSVALNNSNYYSNSVFEKDLNSKKNNNKSKNVNQNNQNMKKPKESFKYGVKINSNGNLNGFQQPNNINNNLQQPYIKKNLGINRPISGPIYYPGNNFINPLNYSFNYNNINKNTVYNSQFKK